MSNYWFDHIHLSAADPVATAEYYEKMFGARRAATLELPGGRLLILLDLNGTRMVVTRPTPRQVETSDGQTISVLEQYGMRTENLETAVAELKAKGVKFVQDITEMPGGTKICFFATPDNVVVELMERHD